MNEKEK
jgi:serine/threonine protein kinase